ncbi:MAG: hypothetical protein GWO24_03320, partial [Akkermansiaceae bacterium]|nr:hypothetical protein [Akkermansiaceae bacterium]
ASDDDHDGWDALSEFLMGTAAADGTQFPLFEVTHVSPTQVEITYGPVLAGRTYEVLSSVDGQGFSSVDSFTAGTNAATNTSTDSTGAEDAEVYK